MNLKCYKGGSYDWDEFEFVAVCFAHDRNEAKRLLWSGSRLAEECDDEWHLARVIRSEDGDKHLACGADDAYIVRDDKTLRLLGWRYEDDNICDSCGLAEMDLHPVCDGCGQCDECGCDCEELEQAG